MKSKNDERLLVGHVERLEKEGIGLSGAIIVLQLDPDRYVISFEGETARLLDGITLKKEIPLIYEIFAHRKDISTVMRTCPRFCAEAAKRGRDIPPVLDDMAQIVGPKARVRDESDSAKIIGVLKRNNACLIKAREAAVSCAIAVGRTPEQAFAATLILEKSAQAYIEGMCIGGAKSLNCFIAWVMHKQYNMVYSKMDTQIKPQTEQDIPRSIPKNEMAIRKEIIECGKKLSEENLVQGTWGNISVRLDKRFMLVTPSGLNYMRLTPCDIVRVDIETLEYEGRLKPTSEKGIHAALLAANPDVNCVIHSHPVNCSVFAAARKPLPVENKTEVALLGKETGYAKAAIPGTRQLVDAVTGAISGGNKTCVMGSHGILVCGDSICDAFEKCRAMEKAARDHLDKVSLHCSASFTAGAIS